jgi:hypothetical protein
VSAPGVNVRRVGLEFPINPGSRSVRLYAKNARSVTSGLQGALPATAAQESAFEVPPSDILVNDALRLARLWRRIAELRSWRPLADAGSLRETLRSLGCGTLEFARSIAGRC